MTEHRIETSDSILNEVIIFLAIEMCAPSIDPSSEVTTNFTTFQKKKIKITGKCQYHGVPGES